jgi:hypothetical protein
MINVDKLLARVVKDFIAEGETVEIDGLGVFQHGPEQNIEFVAETAPRIFISYVVEDTGAALDLADAFKAAGMKPWLDRRRLLPGQNWRRCIEHAIYRSDFFVACFSRAAARKRGQFPCEVRQALRCAERMPIGDSFLIPVRLEDCHVPADIVSQIQYVDLFPDRTKGIQRVIEAISNELAARRLRDVAA